jgi:hypothetical protein
MAISTTLFLFIHTRELHTKLKEMEVKLQPEDMLSGKCGLAVMRLTANFLLN